MATSELKNILIKKLGYVDSLPDLQQNAFYTFCTTQPITINGITLAAGLRCFGLKEYGIFHGIGISLSETVILRDAPDWQILDRKINGGGVNTSLPSADSPGVQHDEYDIKSESKYYYKIYGQHIGNYNIQSKHSSLKKCWNNANKSEWVRRKFSICYTDRFLWQFNSISLDRTRSVYNERDDFKGYPSVSPQLVGSVLIYKLRHPIAISREEVAA